MHHCAVVLETVYVVFKICLKYSVGIDLVSSGESYESLIEIKL